MENGKIFAGRRIGAEIESIGELVFTTGMTGYLETLTDPGCAGQIILQTFPLIGNCGVISTDLEGDCFAKGYVVRELCDTPSNFRSEYKLDRFLKEQGIPGVCGVDTRAITRIIREEGVMNACICDTSSADLQRLKNYKMRGGVSMVSGKTITEYPAEGTELFYVALLDYGVKRSIIRCLCRRGCRVTVLPHDTPAETVLGLKPDGLVLSNGPGDPAENVYEIVQLQKLIGKLPVFGICLGHQLAALAMGGKVVKLKCGHRGANQPVRLIDGSRTWITNQNHGYVVVSESMEGIAKLSYVNVNDLSCEGLDYPDRRCFTVQFHPEARGGPQDTEFLFDRFIAMMKGEQDAKG